MKTLYKKDKINMGVYAGEKLEDVLRSCGKEALFSILKYYNVSSRIMKKYNLHKIATEVDATEMDDAEVDATEMDDAEMDATEVDDAEVDATEMDDAEYWNIESLWQRNLFDIEYRELQKLYY